MAKPVITIVCGTYKRLNTLKRMVQSVRDTLADSVAVDFVIADNASNDGTWDWLQAQPDITALQMDAPVGAIKAFTEAAKRATGDYVVLATDDIYFPPLALLKAHRWLETTPDSGVVAFMHNKNGVFKTDKQKALTIDGIKTGVIYPQICMIRRWLGDLCGWWGGDHPHMQSSFTYGGDNYLGSRVIEHGYRVDEVEGCMDLEDTLQDESRNLSSDRHLADFHNYWALYPDGPTLTDSPTVSNPQPEHLRVLLCLHFNPRWEHHKANKVGMTHALQKLGHVVSYDYALAHEQGRNITGELTALAETWKPHVIWTQVHNASHGLPVEAVQQMRRAAPKAVAINWNGDYWVENIENPATQAMYRQFDLILVQSLFLEKRLCELGICSAYMPHSFEPCVPDTDAAAHDVVYLGNGYTDFRRELLKTLHALPYDVGLYGRSEVVPMNGETNYRYAQSQGIYRNSIIAVSTMQFDHVTGAGFVSNRMWEVMASDGAICLQQYVPMLGELTGLQDGVHYIIWHTVDELLEQIAYYLKYPAKARAIAQQASRFVHEHHSFDNRVRSVLTDIIEAKQWQSASA
jgi:hypothetical protein